MRRPGPPPGGLAVAIILLLISNLGMVVHEGGRSTEVTLDDALRDFRAEPDSGSSVAADADAAAAPPPVGDQAAPTVEEATAPAGPGPGGAGAEEGAPVGGAQVDGDAGSDAGSDDGPDDGPRDGSPVAPSGGPAPAPAPTRPSEAEAAPPQAAEPFRSPQPGVYEYRVTGGEELSTPGGKRDYPSSSVATVRRQDGCAWEVEHRVAEERSERRTYCSRAGELLFAGTLTRVRFYGQSQEGHLVCDPPRLMVRIGDAPGTGREAVCRSDRDESRDTTTYLGLRTVRVGSVEVEAHHIRVDSEFTGRADGTSTIAMWLHPETGLLLRMERSVDSHSDAFGPRVRYQEEATFELVDLEPGT